MLTLDPLPKIITFDCYGTLTQWHRALREASGAILAGHGWPDEAAALAERIRGAANLQQQQPPFRDYHAILRSSLDEALAASGFTAGEQDYAALLTHLAAIPPYPDTAAALARLRTRYRLAIISNTDDALIAGTVAAIGVPIDFVVTAQQAQAYKPDHRLFLHAYATMGVTREETIHVGMGQYTDLKVCHELGIRSVWIDRTGETLNPGWTPDAVLPDLSGLPALLLA